VSGIKKRIKQHWYGIFNHQREVFFEYCYAYTERQAWLIFCRRIADKHGVKPIVVMNYFDGSKDNYKIILETEFKEAI
jgi:hypothetical protein